MPHPSRRVFGLFLGVFSLLGAFAVAGAGCATLESALAGVTRPQARVVGASLADLTPSGAVLNFDIEVENPYAVPLPIAALRYELASGDAGFLSGDAGPQGAVPAGAARRITLPARLDFARALAALESVRPGDVVPYRAAIALGVDAPGAGRIELPVERRGELPIPAVPEVAVDAIRFDSLSLDQAAGVLTLRVKNTNRFAAGLTDLRYALSLAGAEVAQASIAKPLPLGAGESGVLEIPLSFSARRLGLAAFEVLRGRDAAYDIGGDLTLQTPFGPLAAPFRRSGTAPLRR